MPPQQERLSSAGIEIPQFPADVFMTLDTSTLARLAAAATPLPWAEFQERGEYWLRHCAADGTPVGRAICDTTGTSAEDTAYSVAACNAVPELLDELAARDARIAELEADVAHLRKQLPLAQEEWPIQYTRDTDAP